MATTEGRLTHGPELGRLVIELQSYGVRVEDGPIPGRKGGAGPSDSGMIYLNGIPVTFPFSAEYVADSPFTLRREDGAWALLRSGEFLGHADLPPRPKIYELETEDGIPYWQIALLHLDSLASTVIQTCMYWGTEDQCRFCGIELSLDAGATIPVKKPHHLAEVARAAKELDGAVDVTLTTGTTHGPDKGARYLGSCAEAIRDASGLPVQAQFEPPEDFSVFEELKEQGVGTVGMHVESFDPDVLERIGPAKARTGIDGYFRAWEAAVEVFGPGQVTTYVILGMGEDPELTVEGCRRAVDLGVYPFVVPLRPIAGSLMGDELPPPPDYVESLYRQITPYVVAKGLGSWDVNAGCARCRACSGMAAFEAVEEHGADRRRLPILEVR
jgi:radical SAM protein (TIGR04043 family)